MCNSRDRDLDYIGNCLSTLEEIPFGKYSISGKLLRKFWVNGEQIPTFFLQHMKKAIQVMGERHIIRAKIEDLPVAMWIYLSDDGDYYVWGPIQYEIFTAQEAEHYEAMIETECPDYRIYQTTYEKVLAHIACFVFAADHRKFFAEDMQEYRAHLEVERKIERQNLNHIFRSADDELINHSFSEEQYPLELLRAGDEDGMQRYIQLRQLNYPEVLSTDIKKNEEYMAVASVSILSRTAIEAGVPSAESFRLSDVFLSRISKCKDVKSILTEREEALIMFTRLVAKHRASMSQNPYVDDCKKDIATRIYQRISLDDIAKDLGVRATYLSRLFKEAEGISVGQYIRREKIKLASDMLKYSNRTIIEISDYLSFNSQSYFGKIFKEETGMSPETYRKLNRSSEF